MSHVIPARFGGECPVCVQRWTQNTPISPFGDSSEHVGRWGHPACVALDEMGLPSIDSARERIAAIRESLKGGKE